jgi:hypothetical protein
MPEETEMILRKSLDEVDRIRRRQIVGLVIFLLLFLLQAGILILKPSRLRVEPDLRATLTWNAELMLFTVGFCTFGVCLFITRMTSKILKAIELSSKV